MFFEKPQTTAEHNPSVVHAMAALGFCTSPSRLAGASIYIFVHMYCASWYVHTFCAQSLLCLHTDVQCRVYNCFSPVLDKRYSTPCTMATRATVLPPPPGGCHFDFSSDNGWLCCAFLSFLCWCPLLDLTRFHIQTHTVCHRRSCLVPLSQGCLD